MGNVLHVTVPYVKQDIPVVVLFRALGFVTDRDILEHVIYDFDDVEMMGMLKPSLVEAEPIQDKELALDMIGKRGAHRCIPVSGCVYRSVRQRYRGLPRCFHCELAAHHSRVVCFDTNAPVCPSRISTRSYPAGKRAQIEAHQVRTRHSAEGAAPTRGHQRVLCHQEGILPGISRAPRPADGTPPPSHRRSRPLRQQTP